MLRQELQKYLDSIYPFSKIATEHSLSGRVTVRFDLLENDEAEQEDKVKSATERALTIFNDLFENIDNTIWLLSYEYIDDNFFPQSDYIYKQFPTSDLNEFYSEIETVNSRTFITGTDRFEQVKAKITVGRFPVKSVDIRNILNGIANRDNGLEPIITQSVYFFDSNQKIGFHMYDDRGCYIWSDDSSRIKHIYNNRIKWINEFEMEDVKDYFT
jgi:Domain of unknown function (DUF3885)